MKLISHYEVPSGGVSSITFMSVGDIPSEYTDLMLVCSIRTTRAQEIDNLEIKFNSDSSNRSSRYLLGLGSGSPLSGARTILSGGPVSGNSSTASTFGNSSIYIPNYRSNVAKSLSTDSVSENNSTSAGAGIEAGLWNSTSSITSITITSETASNFVQYSSASLYGITAGTDGIVAVS